MVLVRGHGMARHRVALVSYVVSLILDGVMSFSHIRYIRKTCKCRCYSQKC